MQNQPERAVRVFAKMRKIKLLPDMRTYELLFSLFGIVNAPYEDSNMSSQVDAAKRINAIERDMANNGFLHSHRSLKVLVSFVMFPFFVHNLRMLQSYVEFLLLESMKNLNMCLKGGYQLVVNNMFQDANDLKKCFTLVWIC